jgi:hypothetical protein
MWVNHHGDCLLQHVVAERVHHQLLHKEIKALFPVLSFGSKTSNNSLIFIWVGAWKDLIHLGTDFVWIEALFDNVGWELQLAQSQKVFGDHLEDKVVFRGAFELQYILD